MQKTCTQCHTVFECGAGDPSKTCWCAELPKIISPTDTRDCLCPKCLKNRISETEIDQSVADKPKFV